MNIYLKTLLISLPMLTSLFWLAFYVLKIASTHLLNKSNKQLILIFYFATFILYLCHFIYFSGIESALFETIYTIVNLLVYPLFYLYLCNLTSKKLKTNEYLGLFLPSIVILVVYPICLLIESETIKSVFYILARICFFLQVVCVWIIGNKHIHHYLKLLDNYYSDDRSYQFRAFSWLLHLFGSIAIVSSILNFIGKEWFVNNELIFIPAIIMAIMLYALGYVSNTIDIYSNLEHENLNLDIAFPTQTKHDSTNDDINKQQGIDNIESIKLSLSQKLIEIMDSDKPYLNPNLTIQDLALMLNTNRTYLSVTFRDEFGVSFSTYINQKRVEHAKTILSNPNFETNKEAIINAQTNSGFPSESTFYRLFKQQTGISPLVYRQKHIK